MLNRVGLLALLSMLVSGCSSVWRGPELLLTRRGVPAATIVVPDTPLGACNGMGAATLTQATAAEELQKYVEKASGARLPIVPAARAPARGTLILVGRSAVSDAFHLDPPTRPEGLRVVSFRRGVAILGEIADARVAANNTDKDLDRGIMHAVYTFLERQVGCRFYFENRDDTELGIVTPANPTIAIPMPLDYTDAPAFAQRQNYRTSLAATRAGCADHCTGGHTHGDAWAKRYRESHPEYFMMNADGTRNFRYLCYSEPGVLEADLRHVEEWYATGSNMFSSSHPTAGYITVWPDDLYPRGGCACERCKVKAGGGYDSRWSNYWWDYVRRMAEAVSKRWPDKRVLAGAYTTWLNPPDFALPSNVCVQLCICPGGEQSHAHNYMIKQTNLYAKNLSLVTAWSEILGRNPDRLHIREYGYDNTHTGIPILYPHVMQRWLKDIRPLCRGSYFDGICGAGDTPNNYLMTWLQFRLLWNPGLDVDAAIREHCQTFFGPAGEEMEAFYRLLAERYEQPWPANEVAAWTGYGFSISMLYGETYPPEILDRLEESLLAASTAVGLPADPEWDVRSNSAWVLRNTNDASRAYPVSLAPVNGAVMQPTLRWMDGELVYRGTLRTGQRLRVEAGPRATLIEADGMAREVTDRLQGNPPTVAPHATIVVHYSSRQADNRDLLRVTMGNADRAAPSSLNLHQRRLLWLRRHFDVHTMGWGRYSPPDGAFALGRMTQHWLQRGAPAYSVAWLTHPPTEDPDAACWRQTEAISLIQGRDNPQNADVNVGFPADQPTQVKLLQDDTNLYALFRCVQYDRPSDKNDGLVLRLYRGAGKPPLALAVRPDGAFYPPPPDTPWDRTTYETNTTGIVTHVMQRILPMRTLTVRPSRAATVRRDTRQDIGATTYGLYAGHMSSPDGRGLTVFDSYLQFAVPEMKPNERIGCATFNGYLQRYLSATYRCGTVVSYSADDGWGTGTVVFARAPALEEPVTVLNRTKPDDEGRGWFTADVSRYLRKDTEGPGQPLTLGITAAGYPGVRGFAVSMDEAKGLAPSLNLEIAPADFTEEPWWSVMLTIPKEMVAKGGTLTELRADMVRVSEARHYQWSPPLAYIWIYMFPADRRGRLLFERKPEKAVE
ncbi:MAG: DUF4838 domain-containing protein [Kiritimatiellae bacterium]|nr:DUF4838 domain-containing protein [Kiritimatiellia bacterium]